MADIKARRVIRPVPLDTVQLIPSQAVLVNGHFDYIEAEVKEDPPKEAVYVAEMDAAGEVKEVKDETTAKNAAHTFAGWKVPTKGAAELAAMPPKEEIKP